MLAWCGHRNRAAGTSGLVYLRGADTALKIVKCAGVGPDGLEFSSAAFDPSSKTFYVFGGWAAAGPSNEIFRISFAAAAPAWEKIDVKGTKPLPRNGAPMVLDALRKRLIICGGDTGTAHDFRPIADCWQFDLATATWAQLPAAMQPSARWHAAMTVDPHTQKAYLFGGAGSPELDATLYELDLPTNTWRALTTTGSPPPSLQGATFTFDEENHVLVLAGGLRHKPPGPATMSQIWVYDPSTGQWDESDGGDDVRRRDHLGIYNPVTGEHLLIGGRVSETVGNFYERGSLVKVNVKFKIRRRD
jgi:N-acetylneuraminic acid mutarotase